MRLTGLHETQAIDTFSWGVADRGASIRVPHAFVRGRTNTGATSKIGARTPRATPTLSQPAC